MTDAPRAWRARPACSSTASWSRRARGRRFANIDPTTEEVLGDTADGTAARTWTSAIGAARRAFDETAWSTDHELRRRVPRAVPRRRARRTSRSCGP